MDSILTGIQLTVSIIGVIFVIFLAYWGTTWFSKKYSNMSNGKYIQVLERSMISQDKLLVLTKVNDKVYFIGITGQNIETIDTMDADAFPETEESPKSDFASILMDKIKSQIPFIKQKEENKK